MEPTGFVLSNSLAWIVICVTSVFAYYLLVVKKSRTVKMMDAFIGMRFLTILPTRKTKLNFKSV